MTTTISPFFEFITEQVNMLRRAKVSSINSTDDCPPASVKRGLPPPTANGMSHLSPMVARANFPGKEAPPFVDDKNMADSDEEEEEEEEEEGKEEEEEDNEHDVSDQDNDPTADEENDGNDEETKDLDKSSEIGETEEELEVNEAGRQSSSDEEDSINGADSDKDDESDDGREERPWDFVSGKVAATALGRNVKRPVAVGGSRESSPIDKEQGPLDADDDESSNR